MKSSNKKNIIKSSLLVATTSALCAGVFLASNSIVNEKNNSQIVNLNNNLREVAPPITPQPNDPITNNNTIFYLPPNSITAMAGISSTTTVAQIQAKEAEYQKIIDNLQAANNGSLISQNVGFKSLVEALQLLIKKAPAGSNPSAFWGGYAEDSYLGKVSTWVYFNGLQMNNADREKILTGFGINMDITQQFNDYIVIDEVNRWVKDMSGYYENANKRVNLRGQATSIFDISTGTSSNVDLGTEYEAGYNTFVKVAEITPQSGKDIVFKLEAKNRNATLIIKNNNNQIQSSTDNLAQKALKYSIFGRYEVGRGIDATFTSEDYSNFVIQQISNGKIGLFVRLKNGEIINSLRPENPSTVDRFGILDIQKSNKVADSILLEPQTVDNTINQVEFFSDILSFTNNPTVTDLPTDAIESTKVKSININKTLKYFIADNIVMPSSFDLFYSDQSNNLQNINKVENTGPVLGQFLSITPTFLQEAGKISPETIASPEVIFYDQMLTDLGDAKKRAVEDNPLLLGFAMQSKHGTVAPNVWEQNIYFNSDYTGLVENIQQPYFKLNGLAGNGLFYEPIFSSQPKKITDALSNSVWSVKDVKKLSNPNQIIFDKVGDIYIEDWSQSLKPLQTTRQLSFSTTGEVKFQIGQNNKFFNITIDNKQMDYSLTPNEIYKKASLYYSNLQEIVLQLMPSLQTSDNDKKYNLFTQNIFEIKGTQTSSKIIERLISNFGNDDAFIKEFQTLLNIDDQGNQTTPPTTEQISQINVIIAKLIENSYNDLVDTFNKQINAWFLSQVQTWANDPTSKTKIINPTVVKAFLDKETNLFEKVTTEKFFQDAEGTNKQKINGLLNFLYISSPSSNLYLGSSLFGPPNLDEPNSIGTVFSLLASNKSNISFDTELDKILDQPGIFNNIYAFYNTLFASLSPSNEYSFDLLKNNSLKSGNKIEVKWGNNTVNGIDGIFNFIDTQLSTPLLLAFPGTSTSGLVNQQINKLSMVAASSNMISILIKKYEENKINDVYQAKLYKNALDTSFSNPIILYYFMNAYSSVHPELLNNFSNLEQFTNFASTQQGATKLNELMNEDVVKYVLKLISPTGIKDNWNFTIWNQIVPIALALIAVGIFIPSSIILSKKSKIQSLSNISKIAIIILMVISVAILAFSILSFISFI
ncbi:MAG: hypothetical protein ACRCRP_02215 [Metamycoplasmataceae bacterium]